MRSKAAKVIMRLPIAIVPMHRIDLVKALEKLPLGPDKSFCPS